MHFVATFKPACVLALAFALTGSLAATLQDANAAMSRDGLEPIQIKNLDLAYARPGSTLAPYKRVRLDPVAVEFHRQWNPERTGSRLKLTSQDKENIRVAVAEIVQDEFAKEMQRGGAYPVTSDAGNDVLVIKPRIVNVYLNAPDAGNSARTRTFVSTAGEMTLVAELSDSASGQVLTRVADRREATTTGFRLGRVNGFVNENEAREIASQWARILRRTLDQAHGVSQ